MSHPVWQVTYQFLLVAHSKVSYIHINSPITVRFTISAVSASAELPVYARQNNC